MYSIRRKSGLRGNCKCGAVWQRCSPRVTCPASLEQIIGSESLKAYRWSFPAGHKCYWGAQGGWWVTFHGQQQTLISDLSLLGQKHRI